MSQFIILMAAIDAGDNATKGLFQSWNSMSAGKRELIIISGAVLLVVLALLFWAIFIRPPRRQRSPYHGGRKSERGLLLTDSEKKSHRTRHRWFGFGKRRKHRRRRERPRNPTLAETGGLPPIRTDEPTDPIP